MGVFLALALPAPGAGQAILNVERLQSGEVSGLHGEFNGRLNMARGNTDLLQVGGTFGTGFKAPRHWTRAYLGMDRLNKGDSKILDNRYLHLRYNYFFTERVRSFHFFQVQTNRNLLLRNRWLAGTGLRVRPLGGDGGKLEVGSGLMYEAESLRESALSPGEDPDTRTLRLSNLLVGSWTPGEGTRLVAVVYHQPDVGRLRDYRLLGELGLAVALTRRLELEVSMDWRHDSRAPGALEEDDVGMRTGLTYRLR